MRSSHAPGANIRLAARMRDGADSSPTVEKLGAEHRDEILSFLAARGGVHSVFMSGLIRDNGVVSPLNRGAFYCCRDGADGSLEGVALIGHATLFKTRSEEALAAFAHLARSCARSHLILGDQGEVESFWNSYAPHSGRESRRVCRELLFEHRGPVRARKPVPGLRQATLEHLSLVMRINAEMAFEECGIDPFKRDALGFRQRTARRIEQGRIWIWVENGQPIFKADIVADTPEAVYLEGIYVNPQERRKGYGLRCLTQLSRILLSRAESVCLVVNEEQKEAQAFYRKAGYKQTTQYDTIWLERASFSPAASAAS